MSDVRVLVTGSRETTDEQDAFVARTLARVCSDALGTGRRVVVIEGRCHKGGVDRAAQRWAETTPGVENEGYPADWNRYGKRAGMIRNGEMVATGADICIAFPGDESVGTWDCLKQAAKAGIPGRVYPLGGATRSGPPGGDDA